MILLFCEMWPSHVLKMFGEIDPFKWKIGINVLQLYLKTDYRSDYHQNTIFRCVVWCPQKVIINVWTQVVWSLFQAANHSGLLREHKQDSWRWNLSVAPSSRLSFSELLGATVHRSHKHGIMCHSNTVSRIQTGYVPTLPSVVFRFILNSSSDMIIKTTET